jgi:type IV pilus assembly protein PilM
MLWSAGHRCAEHRSKENQVGRTVVGLDIGHTAVRAVGFSSASTVTAMATAPVTPGAVHEGEVLDVSSVAEAIKEAWAKSGLGKDVVIGLSGRHVIVRPMELPWLEEKAFRKALPYRVAGQLPVPVEDVILDYIELGTHDGAEGRTLRFLLVAAMRQPVLRAVEAAQKAGLRPIRIDLAGLALLRLRDDAELGAGVAEARVDIGAEVTTVVVRVDGVPTFVRMLAGEGGDLVTRALSERLVLSPEEAEALKRRIGTSEAEAGDSAGGRALSAEEKAARVIIDRITDSTLAAVRSSLDYYLSSDDAVAGLGRVVLSGGGAMLPGLVERFGGELGIPAVLADPLGGVTVPLKANVDVTEVHPALAVAAGLGLVEVA